MKNTLRYTIAILFIIGQLVFVAPAFADVDATQQLHYVTRGETLASIASRYGSTCPLKLDTFRGFLLEQRRTHAVL